MSGVFKGRREDGRLITGQGRYTADWNLPGQAYGCFLRCRPRPCRDRRRSTPRGGGLPGVLAVFTGADLAQCRLQDAATADVLQGQGRHGCKSPHRPALAHGRVRFVGEAVALVVARLEARRRTPPRGSIVEYRDLPAVVEPRRMRSHPAPAAARRRARAISRSTTSTATRPRPRQLSPAPHRSCASMFAPSASPASDGAEGLRGRLRRRARDSYDIYMPTQGMSEIRNEFAHVTGVERERFRIHAHDVGGGFGVRNEIYPEFSALVLRGARSLGRPVKWVGTRAETHRERPPRTRRRLVRGARPRQADGHFLALRVRLARQPRRVLLGRGPFHQHRRRPDQHGDQRLPHPGGLRPEPAGVHQSRRRLPPYRGAGRPNVVLPGRASGRRGGAPHRHRSRRAPAAQPPAQGGVPLQDTDRLDLRQRRSAGPAWRRSLEAADWDGFRTPPHRSESARPAARHRLCRRSSSPPAAPAQEEIAIRFDAPGACELFTLSGPSGPGPRDRVSRSRRRDSRAVAPEQGDAAGQRSRRTAAGRHRLVRFALADQPRRRAVARSAQRWSQKGLVLAAKELEVAADDIVFEHGRYRVPGHRSCRSVWTSWPASTPAVAPSARHRPPSSIRRRRFPSGAHVAEVEIDPDTGVLELAALRRGRRLRARSYNHTLVEGQLHGGLMQGIGQIFGRALRLRPRQRPAPDRHVHGLLHAARGSRCRTFALLRPLRCPRPAIRSASRVPARPARPAPSRPSPMRSSTRFRRSGIHRLEMPYSPHRVWAAIAEKRAGSKG